MKSSPCKVGLGCILTALPLERKPVETRLRSSGIFNMELLLSVQLLLSWHVGDMILSHQVLSVCWRRIIQVCIIIALVATGARVASKDVVLFDAFPVASCPTNDLCCGATVALLLAFYTQSEAQSA